MVRYGVLIKTIKDHILSWNSLRLDRYAPSVVPDITCLAIYLQLRAASRTGNDLCYTEA